MTAQKEKPVTLTCSQCEKPAIGEVGGVWLCVNCYTKLQTAHTQAQVAQTEMLRNLMAMQNQAAAEMESVVGLPGLLPRIKIPPMPPAPVTLNNIKFDNSVVGAVNTGFVRDIEVNLTHLHNDGNEKATDALKALTEAILRDPSVDTTHKNDLVEQIAFLSEQAVLAAKDRKSGLIKRTLGTLTQAAGTVTAMGGAWQAAEPILKSLFGP
jgi:hypothetical protein